jgi:hypothetical protein
MRRTVEAVRQLPQSAKILEVGSGAHAYLLPPNAGAIGVDPLADEYRQLFPKWQGRAETIAAYGEDLPFDDASFDLVLCDNVVDHAEGPRRISRRDIARTKAERLALLPPSTSITRSTISLPWLMALGERSGFHLRSHLSLTILCISHCRQHVSS